MVNRSKNFIKRRKLTFKKDNLIEDKVIKGLEKKLKINKRASKHLPKSFVSDGLDYLLDICDGDTRKVIADSQKRLLLHSNESKDFEKDYNIETELKSNIKKENNINKGKRKQSNCEQITESYPNNYLNNNCDNDNYINYTDIVENIQYNEKNATKNNKSNGEVESNKSSCSGYINKHFITKKKKIKDRKDLITLKNKSAKKSKIFTNKLLENELNKTNGHSLKEKLNSNSLHKKINLNDLSQEINFQKEDLWEDIYGRKRNKDGIVITENKQKYITPALRLNNSEDKNENLLLLKRQLKGLLNRLAESNMHVIISKLDELYMSNSRNDMNEMLLNVMLESIIAPVLTMERLVIEHMMCIAILHANIGTEVGAHFIMILIKKFNEIIQQPQDVQNKELDNLCLMISYLYNFKVFGSQLIHEILEKLIHKFTEKEIELILLFLKTAGFKLRKDDPVALKELILNIHKKAAVVKSSNSRVQFMLDILLALKNNNTNKIPQYDPSHIEHLKKILKTLVRKGNTISQLNLSYEDLLNVDERGKWWIVGSAWTGKSLPKNMLKKDSDDKPVYSQKILNLAQTQRMNTDIRKNIFCILMTAEDYLDAFEKLHHLGLKDRQEREIIYVILNCLLQEKTFNPYYSVLIQKFCEYDRKYQIIMQYILWDKIKMLNNYSSKQVISLAKFMSHLFIQKALPLSILKVIELGELDTLTMKLFRKIMLDILLYKNTEICLNVFGRIAHSTKLQQFREGLRLFINYFLLKNIKKDKLPEKQFQLLEKRIEMTDKILTTSVSKLLF